jgi:microtubule-associated protein-like 6
MTFEDEDFQADQAGAPGEGQDEPWRSSIDFPDDISSMTQDLKTKLKSNLKLDYVFGYRSKDTRNNLYYLKENVIVYHAASLGIIMNLDSNTQQYFTGHMEDIQSFAINDSKTLIATGENCNKSGIKSSVCVWDPQCKEQMRFQGMFEKGVNVLCFSPNGSKLLAISLDENHTIFLFDMKQKKLICSTSGGNSKILDACFKNDKEFVTVGLKHYKYWMINDNQFFCKDGIFGNDTKVDNKIGLVKLSNNNFVTGSATGEVTIWDEEKIIIMKKCHTKYVDCMYTKDNIILTGGRDYTIVILDKDLSELRRILLDTTKVDSVLSLPRSLEISPISSNKILLGTLSSEIFELTFSTSNILTGDFTSTNYLYGHYSQSREDANEINGISYLTKKDLFVTVSDDSTLRFWDAEKNKQVEYFKLDIDNNGQKIKNSEGLNISKAQCVDGNLKETHIAVGFIDGSVRIYCIQDVFFIDKIINFRKSSCTDVKFSPNGNFLAVSFKEGIIDILNTDDYLKIFSLDGHTESVNRIDWSIDSNFLSSSSVNGELNFYNMKKGTKIIRTSDLKNEEWNTWTRIYGWPVQGIWENNDDSIYACNRSKYEIKGNKLIAFGGENGIVKVFK